MRRDDVSSVAFSLAILYIGRVMTRIFFYCDDKHIKILRLTSALSKKNLLRKEGFSDMFRVFLKAFLWKNLGELFFIKLQHKFLFLELTFWIFFFNLNPLNTEIQNGPILLNFTIFKLLIICEIQWIQWSDLQSPFTSLL